MHGDAAATNNLPTSTPGKEIQSIQLNPFKLLSKRSFSFYLANVVDILKKASNPTSTIIQNLRFSIFRNFTRNYIYTPHDQLIKLINYLYTEDIIICLLDKNIGRLRRKQWNQLSWSYTWICFLCRDDLHCKFGLLSQTCELLLISILAISHQWSRIIYKTYTSYLLNQNSVLGKQH